MFGQNSLLGMMRQRMGMACCKWRLAQANMQLRTSSYCHAGIVQSVSLCVSERKSKATYRKIPQKSTYKGITLGTGQVLCLGSNQGAIHVEAAQQGMVEGPAASKVEHARALGALPHIPHQQLQVYMQKPASVSAAAATAVATAAAMPLLLQ
eukprot:1159316-Pelagomonas_calceolata.AAC.5